MTPTGFTSNNPSSSFAFLCTGTQTYQLRQVHSSNSILLVRPSDASRSVDKSAVSVIASLKSTLELHQTVASVISHLEKLLAVYHGPQDASDDFETIDLPSSREKKTKTAIFADVPASDGECEQAWVALCGFEDSGVAYRPSASALSGLWKAIYSAAASEPINLCHLIDMNALWRAMEEEGYPVSLIQAVLLRLAADATNSAGSKHSPSRLSQLHPV